MIKTGLPLLLKNSSVKNSLHKHWLNTKSTDDEVQYEQYCKVFRQTAAAAEKLYYQEMFDARNNSLKQLWQNLNEVFHFKGRDGSRSCNTSKLVNNNKTFTNRGYL
jgi:hypothetical protein